MSPGKLNDILESLHPLECSVFSVFKKMGGNPIRDELISQEGDLNESRLSMAAGWLVAKNLLTVETRETNTTITVTELGLKYLSKDFPILNMISRLEKGEKLVISNLRQEWDPSEVSKAVGDLKRDGVIQVVSGGILEGIPSIEGSSPLVDRWKHLKKLAQEISQKDTAFLEEYTPIEKNIIEEFSSSRGKQGTFSLQERQKKIYGLTNLGKAVLQDFQSASFSQKEVSQLTPNMLKDGSWKDTRFRKYNITLKPSRAALGRRHPYREFLDDIKMKLVGMGFEEMRGGLVESEFWNSDALFMPQFHPARAIHDVYFVQHPQYSKSLPRTLLERVGKTHQNGWKTGSTGWRYAFNAKRAQRLVLRSQGTAVSARTLASKPKIPGKYFSIARCFRYDKVDNTHAPDFYQVEGIVLGEDINFRTLLGLLKLFGVEMAKAKEMKFLPAYFPYTEPSVELHAKHSHLGWMELGGAGLFRPEVTLPLGVSVPVIAWGLGLDRMAMMALGINDIRDLFSVDLDFVRAKKLQVE